MHTKVAFKQCAVFGKQCSVFGVLFRCPNTFGFEQCSDLNVFGIMFVFGHVRARVRIICVCSCSCSCSLRHDVFSARSCFCSDVRSCSCLCSEYCASKSHNTIKTLLCVWEPSSYKAIGHVQIAKL